MCSHQCRAYIAEPKQGHCRHVIAKATSIRIISAHENHEYVESCMADCWSRRLGLKTSIAQGICIVLAFREGLKCISVFYREALQSIGPPSCASEVPKPVPCGTLHGLRSCPEHALPIVQQRLSRGLKWQSVATDISIPNKRLRRKEVSF